MNNPYQAPQTQECSHEDAQQVDKTKLRPWMFAYTIVFVALCVWGIYSDFPRHSFAYILRDTLVDLAMIVGNILFSFNYMNPAIRAIWKFMFPLGSIIFTSGIIIDGYISQKSHVYRSPLIYVITYAIIFVVYLPTFRANFLLAYGRDSRLEKKPAE